MNEMTAFDRYCHEAGIEPNTPECSTSYKAWSAARDLFLSAQLAALGRAWWDLWIAMWEVIAWAESWSEASAKLQCLRLHGPACDLKGHWFAPWTKVGFAS